MEEKKEEKEKLDEPRHSIVEKLYDEVYTKFQNKAVDLKATHQEVMIMMMYFNDKINEDRLRIIHRLLHLEENGEKKPPPTTSMYS